MDRDDVPYAMQVSTGPVENAYVRDEGDLSTLVRVRRILDSELDELNNVNAFDLTEQGGLSVKEQIAVHQKTYEIISSVRDAVATAIDNVNEKYRG